ncbi:restriction endonuclease subunit S [Acinetobacter proteolyticus]|nr:restriction endonuclease subunit S [Acinetobacter proteolyticus]WEI19575.1 restriction endonuclease subunit S [Acinetobacter proteolyticus]
MALTKKISDIIKEDTTGLLSKHVSWLRIELSDVATILNGFAFPSSYFNNEGIGLPLIRIRDVTEGHTKTYYSGDYDDLYLVSQNEILVGMDGDFNLGLWKSLPSLLNQRVCKISLKNDNIYDKQFLIYLLPPYLKAINDATSSITVKHLSSQTLNTLLLPLPPLNEQKRIADKIDELFSELDNGIEELETAQKKLELYRQSLLKSGVEGELSKEWRETQTEISETGEQLLARMLKERRERWEQKKLKEFAEKGKNPPKDWQEKYPEPVQPDTENLPQLPEGWVWSSIGECFEVKVGATPSRKIPEYWNGEIPWVSSGEVRFNLINETKENITPFGLNNSSTQLNPKGSVLLGMIGEGKTRGQVAILDIEAANNQNCAAIWVPKTDISSYYVYYWLWSQYEQTRRSSSGNNQPALNKSIVEKIPFPLTSIDEINQIVKIISKELIKLDELLISNENLLITLKSQKQNILKKLLMDF